MRTRVMFALMLLAAATACKSSTSPTDSYVGSYALKTYNGFTLPYTATVSGVSFTLNSGTVSVLANGTWSSSLTATPSSVSSTASGTYTVSGSTLTFTNTVDGSKATATFANNSLTAVTGTPPITLVYTKT
jgi:hypothetical protein